MRADASPGDRIARPRFAAWLADTRERTIRIVCAPLGSGKTCALREYADTRGGRTGYVRISPAAGPDTIRDILARGGGFDELVLDGIDRAEPGVPQTLLDDVADGALSMRLILTGRSRRDLMEHAFVARGLATACDPELLRLDGEEISRLAILMDVAHDEQDVEQLLYDTEGWVIAAQWILRDAAESRRSLRDAFVPWRERNAHLLQEYVEDEIGKAGGSVAAFRDLLRLDVPIDDAGDLERLGIPVVRTRGGLRPNRVLARLGNPSGSATSGNPAASPMVVNAFGRFRCEIGGRPVPFMRRRDQNVFTYVALSRGARLSRTDLIEAFWPGVNRAVASQSLRTTLSRIRRAIASVAPSTDPDLYIRTVGEVRIDARTVSVDVHRFADHIDAGRADESDDRIDAAKQHYCIAQRTYADRLLASEAREGCLDRFADGFEALFVWVLRRLIELHAASGDHDKARAAARALRSCNCDEAESTAFCSIAGLAKASA